MRKSERLDEDIGLQDGEIAKPIQGYENKYLITSYGRIWSIRSNKWLKYSVPSNGYAQVGLSLNNKRTSYMIHRLVAKTFLQKPTNKDYVNHIDGNKLNNCVNNLEWVTRSENEKHAFANKLKRQLSITQAASFPLHYLIIFQKCFTLCKLLYIIKL